MSAKIVALAGSNGYVGKAFADAFLNANGFQLRILARATSVGILPILGLSILLTFALA
jgi:nucleoside-diphosphate-sugar epimerase